jgi:glycosyltransferase involved in cell wall biosynthesis
MPYFSIIIPTFNSGTTLSEALNSLRKQTFRDFEIVIVDGLSLDNTVSIARSYLEFGLQLRIVSEKDQGVYDAMNKGVGMSSSELIYFMGGDDALYDENVLQDIFEEASKNEADVIYGNVNSNRLGENYDGEFDEAKIYEKNICHQAIFLNREVFEKVGGFNLRYFTHSDWDHNLRWFLNDGIKKKYINRTIAFYADSGLSSHKGDAIFQIEKADIFFKYKGGKLKKKLLKRIYMGMAIKRKEENKYFPFIYYKLKSWLTQNA